ncbi:hypothetical protein ACSSS7_007842 [Eimeria intestinalis]
MPNLVTCPSANDALQPAAPPPKPERRSYHPLSLHQNSQSSLRTHWPGHPGQGRAAAHAQMGRRQRHRRQRVAFPERLQGRRLYDVFCTLLINGIGPLQRLRDRLAASDSGAGAKAPGADGTMAVDQARPLIRHSGGGSGGAGSQAVPPRLLRSGTQTQRPHPLELRHMLLEGHVGGTKISNADVTLHQQDRRDIIFQPKINSEKLSAAGAPVEEGTGGGGGHVAVALAPPSRDRRPREQRIESVATVKRIGLSSSGISGSYSGMSFQSLTPRARGDGRAMKNLEYSVKRSRLGPPTRRAHNFEELRDAYVVTLLLDFRECAGLDVPNFLSGGRILQLLLHRVHGYCGRSGPASLYRQPLDCSSGLPRLVPHSLKGLEAPMKVRGLNFPITRPGSCRLQRFRSVPFPNFRTRADRGGDCAFRRVRQGLHGELWGGARGQDRGERLPSSPGAGVWVRSRMLAGCCPCAVRGSHASPPPPLWDTQRRPAKARAGVGAGSPGLDRAGPGLAMLWAGWFQQLGTTKGFRGRGVEKFYISAVSKMFCTCDGVDELGRGAGPENPFNNEWAFKCERDFCSSGTVIGGTRRATCIPGLRRCESTRNGLRFSSATRWRARRTAKRPRKRA